MNLRQSLELGALSVLLCVPTACGGTVTAGTTAAETGDAAPPGSGGAPGASSGGAPSLGSGGASQSGGVTGAAGTQGTGGGSNGTCVLNSDCSGPLVCWFGACHAECVSSKDCPATERCVAGSGPSVCLLVAEAHCLYNSDCPAPLVCAVDMQCRNQCVTMRDCPAGQLCTGGTCADPGEVSVLDGGPACVSGGACVMPGKPCMLGVFACDGTNPAFCKPTAPEADGTACGLNLICVGGACVPASH